MRGQDRRTVQDEGFDVAGGHGAWWMANEMEGDERMRGSKDVVIYKLFYNF